LFQQYFKTHLIKVIDTAEIIDTTIYEVKQKVQLELDFNEDQTDYLLIIEELINNPESIDKIVFGKKEITELLESGQLETLYVQKDYPSVEKLMSGEVKTNIILINNPLFSKYGGLVGVKYY